MAILIKNVKPSTVFVHVPKAGGGSFVSFIKSTKGVVYDRSDNDHEMFKNLKGKFDDSFAIVRNPWDRAVSYYFFVYTMAEKTLKNKTYRDINHKETLQKELVLSELGFEFFIKENWHDPKKPFTAHTNQVEWVTGVNKIFRFEKYGEAVAYIQNLLKQRNKKFPHTHKTNHLNYREYYTPELVNFVGDIYSRDIEKFNYDF
jgi:hypothetical protein